MRLIRHALGVVCALALGAATVAEAAAQRRVAFVVGNAGYEHAGVLANTINDANAVAAMLKRAGFDVVDERRDVGVVEFKRAIREFFVAASNADVAVVYYSGHGIEVGGVNYLIPVDAKLASDYDVDDEAIPLDRLIQATQAAKTLSLIILDACRDNPFLRIASRGDQAKRSMGNRLVGVEPTGAGTLIAYAAKAGSVSFDGGGSNSPFTSALVRYLPEPGLDIRIALGKVRDDVMQNTGNRQEPFVYGSLGGEDIALVPAPKAAPSPSVAEPDPAATDYAFAERIGSLAAWQAFLAEHGSGYYATLARAQLAKMAAGAPEAVVALEKHVAGPKVAALEDPSKAAQGSDGAGSHKNAPSTPAPTPIAIETPKPPPDDACKSDEARLARLRLDPDPVQVAKFANELACERLRPQISRFMESLGLPLPTKSATRAAAVGPEDACKRDAAALERLRANPDRAAAAQFAHTLTCESLRPQAARLLDSLGGP